MSGLIVKEPLTGKLRFLRTLNVYGHLSYRLKVEKVTGDDRRVFFLTPIPFLDSFKRRDHMSSYKEYFVSTNRGVFIFLREKVDQSSFIRNDNLFIIFICSRRRFQPKTISFSSSFSVAVTTFLSCVRIIWSISRLGTTVTSVLPLRTLITLLGY